jgi:hypothetical protein
MAAGRGLMGHDPVRLGGLAQGLVLVAFLPPPGRSDGSRRLTGLSQRPSLDGGLELVELFFSRRRGSSAFSARNASNSRRSDEIRAAISGGRIITQGNHIHARLTPAKIHENKNPPQLW